MLAPRRSVLGNNAVINTAGSTHRSEAVVELRDARIISVAGYTLRGILPGLSESQQ